MARTVMFRISLTACLLLLFWCFALPSLALSETSAVWRHALDCPLSPTGAAPWILRMQLRGGTDAENDKPARNPRAWDVNDVLAFVESLRWKFAERTESYKTLMEENDIDGKVLLGLSPSKLQTIGMKSLGHREFFIEQVLALRSSVGLAVGPSPGQFEAAMAAQNAPPKTPPVKIATTASSDSQPAKAWVSIDRVAWDQQERNVDYYVFLDGVGGVAKDDITIHIDEGSLSVEVTNLDGRNYRHRIPRLHAKIQPQDSFFKVKKDSICFKLYKARQTNWSKMHFDPKAAAEEAEMMEKVKGDPANAIVELMKGMYEGGDDETKRYMVKAWQEAQQKHARGDNTPWESPSKRMH